MTVSSLSALQAAAEQIRLETRLRNNTAQRVGQALRDIVDSMSGATEAVDVRAFGDVGTSDDTAVLVAALAGVSATGAVLIPAGVTVTVTGVTLTSREIRGPGTLKWVAGATTTMLTLAGDGAALTNLVIDGNGALQTAGIGTVVGVRTLAAPNVTLVGCTFQNFRDKLIQTDIADSPGGGVVHCKFVACGTVVNANNLAILSSDWSVIGNEFSETLTDGHYIRTGLFVRDDANPVSNTIIANNQFSGTNTGSGVVLELNSQDSLVDSNTFYQVRNPIKMEAAGYTVFGTIIVGNTFRSCSGSNTPFTWAGAGTYSGNRFYDCDGGISVEQGAIVEGNYLDNCGDGTTSAIHSFSTSTGVYRVAGNIIVNAVGGAPGIEIGVGNATIEGNWVSRATGSAMTDGIIARGGNTKIVGNTVTNEGGRGIRVFRELNSVHQNTIDGATNALSLESTCASSEVTHNIIKNASSTPISFTEGASMRSNLVKDNIGATGLNFDLTISGGSVSIGQSTLQVALETESAAATDELDTLVATGLFPGHTVVLHDNSSARDVTVRHNVGNVFLNQAMPSGGATGFTMADSQHKLGLVWTGTRWNEIFRSTV